MGSTISLESAEKIVSRWNSEPNDHLIFDRGSAEITQYLQAVDKILKSATNLEKQNDVVLKAVSRLQHEFETVLGRQTDPLMGPISTTESSSITDGTGYEFRFAEYVKYDPPSKDVISYLREIAERMNSGAFLNDCIRVYKRVRKPFVDSAIKRLQLEDLKASYSERISKEMLKRNIEMWVGVSRVCVRVIFKKEKELADQVFQGMGSSVVDGCFIGTVKDAADKLFSFAKAVSSSRQPYEKMEMILILYNALLSLRRDINDLVQSESGNTIKRGTAEIISRLENEIRTMLSDFQSAVLSDLSTIPDGGSVHHLTAYVMDYIDTIVNCKSIFTKLIVSKPSGRFGHLTISDEELRLVEKQDPVASHLILIIVVLQVNLERKSKDLKEVSLGHLFLMNNIRHILQRIEGSNDLQGMIGADFQKKLREKVNGAMTSYQKSTSDRFLNCLKDEGLYFTCCFSSRVSKSALKRKMKDFNAVFEQVQVLQSSWTIPDTHIQARIRQSLLEILIPEYESFLKTFRTHVNSTSQSCAKYSVQDLRDLVSKNLFARSQRSSPAIGTHPNLLDER